jgi:hypothetical protein
LGFRHKRFLENSDSAFDCEAIIPKVTRILKVTPLYRCRDNRNSIGCAEFPRLFATRGCQPGGLVDQPKITGSPKIGGTLLMEVKNYKDGI